MGDRSDRWFGETLLKQAQANLGQTETNLEQRVPYTSKPAQDCKDSVVDMEEPDRLEAWYVAYSDAEAGAIIVELMAHETERMWPDGQQIVGSTAELGNAGGKGPSFEKATATQAIVPKPVVGTKRRLPSVFEL